MAADKIGDPDLLPGTTCIKKSPKSSIRRSAEKETIIKFLSQNQQLQEVYRTQCITHTMKHPSSVDETEKRDTNCISYCHGCDEPIFDRYIWQILDWTWHAECLVCTVCHQKLTSKCYNKDGKILCKNDFFRTYGAKCASCDQGIAPDDLVRHAADHCYHVECFVCYVCTKNFATGEEFYLMENKKVVCKADYENSKSKETSNKRPRTTISAKQLETLKIAYNASSKPARHIREQLSHDTGLDMRVVQVWFQNRRAKEKRLKKDAGRNGWNYFNRGGKKFDLDDDDMLDEDTSSEKRGFTGSGSRQSGYIDDDCSSYDSYGKSVYSSPDANPSFAGGIYQQNPVPDHYRPGYINNVCFAGGASSFS